MLSLLVIMALLIVGYWVWQRPRMAAERRGRVRALPFPEAWRALLGGRVALYRALPERLRRVLEGHVMVFLAEKRFEGCGGLKIDDEMRLVIAAQACLLILGDREPEYFPRADTVLVYPASFVREEDVPLDGEAAVPMAAELDGESWQQGLVVLAWDHVSAEAADPRGGRNLVLHEFAHQIDAATGASSGDKELSLILKAECEALWRGIEKGREGFLDDDAAENEAEFFAVATEAFFTIPQEMREAMPELYRGLAVFYALDPGAW